MKSAELPLVESVWIAAAPERVFPFFTDPARLVKWLGHTAELDPVPGGRFAVDIDQRPVRGSYLELEPPRRVVFSWGDAGSAELPPGASRVEVELEVAGDGTQLTLRHFGLNPRQRADHALGWPIVLGRLVAACDPIVD